MKNILIIIALSISLSVQAQVTKVSLQASGLTCSMCSNSINKALKTLSFVDKIEPDIQTSTFEITFKTGNNVDFDAIKQKVEKAGFSVAAFIVTVDCNDVAVTPGNPVTIAGKSFYFINTKNQVLTGSKNLKVLNKGFVPGKEYKKYAASIPPSSKDVYYTSI